MNQELVSEQVVFGDVSFGPVSLGSSYGVVVYFDRSLMPDGAGAHLVFTLTVTGRENEEPVIKSESTYLGAAVEGQLVGGAGVADKERVPLSDGSFTHDRKLWSSVTLEGTFTVTGLPFPTRIWVEY